MTHKFFIALDRPANPVYSGPNHAALEPLLITMGDTLSISAAFMTAGVISGLSSPSGRLVIKATDAPDGDTLVTDESMAESGSGITARYAFSVVVSGSALSALLGSLTEITCTLQLEWTVAGVISHMQSIPITILNAVARPDDDFPDSALDARWAWLKARLAAGDACEFSYDEVAKTITINLTSDVISADDGYSPTHAIVADGSRRVQQIIGWTGGSGTPPASPRYIGASGPTEVIGEATDIRGPAGATGAQGIQGIQGIQGETGPSGGEPGATGADGEKGWSMVLSLAEDGDRCVLQIVGWTGGEGDAPTDYVNYYLGIAGPTIDIGSGLDIRGLTGADGADGTILGEDTGWGAWTGTPDKTSQDTYDAPTISGTYTAAEVQAIADATQANARAIKALIDAFLAAEIPAA